jgi:NhaP-type Na+/H+ or K+/H+ antiporter
VFLVAELALVLVLFTDAARINPQRIRGNPIPARLLLIGMPLSIGLGTLVGLVVLTGLEPWECAIVAAVLAPTDAALGQAVITSPRLPRKVREALDVESGLNDGASVPFLMLFIALAAAEEGIDDGWVLFAVEQIGFGAAIGIAVGAGGGWALRRSVERAWTTATFEKLGLAALAVIAWFAADAAGGNGFIAAFVGGSAAGVTAGPSRFKLTGFAEEQGELLGLAVFFIFGVFAAQVLDETTWAVIGYALLSLTLVRMLPVALAVFGLGLRARTIAFLGWFGPRGLASIILALVVVEEEPGLAGLREIFLTMTVTVLLSVFAHGISAAPLTRAFGPARPAPRDPRSRRSRPRSRRPPAPREPVA